MATWMILPLLLGGCYKNTYSTELTSASSQTIKAKFFVYGLVGEETVHLDQICPEGVAWFQNRMDPVDGVLTCLTCRLYTPRTIEVRCASGSAWLTVPDESQNLTWVYGLDDDGNVMESKHDPVLLNGGAE